MISNPKSLTSEVPLPLAQPLNCSGFPLLSSPLIRDEVAILILAAVTRFPKNYPLADLLSALVMLLEKDSSTDFIMGLFLNLPQELDCILDTLLSTASRLSSYQNAISGTFHFGVIF
jgi:hypothetical protein